MSRASLSPPADPDNLPSTPFVPPPVQRLSRSFTGLSVSKSLPAAPCDLRSILPLRPTPLPGPNRAPTVPAPPHPQSSSSKPSNIFPRLHRLEIADDMPTNQKKPPLLELKLSSSSFLDAVATDSDSEKSLYAVETVGSSTTIWRSDPWDSSAKIADIRWPKDLPLKGKGKDPIQGAMIQIDDLRWRDTSTLLKSSNLGSSRKFRIPHHPHALKWKREGNVYTCTTLACKGAVAILDSFHGPGTAPRLRVFETLGSLHQSVPQLDHAGISLFLLDHLFVTALLLVTEPDDWMTLSRNPSSLPPSVPASFKTTSNSLASNRQWRKIMYGEPLYPSLKTPAFDKGVVNCAEDADILDVSEPPQPSTSTRQWRKIVYGEPLYPSLRPQSADRFDPPPRPSTATSLSSDSACSPHTPSSGPSTRFYDAPSLFDDTERTRSRNGSETAQSASPLALSSTLSPLPSSECIRLSPLGISSPPGGRRELPSPPSSYQPPPSIQPWLHRSRSTPKLSPSTQSLTPSGGDPDEVTQVANPTPPTRIAVRQLPTPPQELPRPAEVKRLSQTHQRSLPPTPASMSRSSSAAPQHHGYSLSHDVAFHSPPQTMARRPSTVDQGPSIAVQNDQAVGGRRARNEKDADEVVSWMRNFERAHRRRGVDGEDHEHASGRYDSMYDPPPPAYKDIDFSTPPQARSPLEGSQSRSHLLSR